MQRMIIVFISCLLVSSVAMGGQKHKKSHGYQAPVVVPAIGFTATQGNDTVVTTWKRYLRDDLKYYKVVKSKHNPDPVYPEDGYTFYSADASATRYVDPKISAGTWYYRVCIITRQGDRWVSPVVTVHIDRASLQGAVPSSKDFE